MTVVLCLISCIFTALKEFKTHCPFHNETQADAHVQYTSLLLHLLEIPLYQEAEALLQPTIQLT